MDACRARAEEARHQALAAERDARDAARAGDSAIAALERVEAHRTELQQRRADLEPVVDASREAVAAAERSLAALPDPASLEQEVESARSAATAAATAAADKRAESATKARETATDRERHSTAGREQAEWRRRQSDAETRLAEALERQKDQAAERCELEPQPAELGRQIADLERANSEIQAKVGEASAAEHDAERERIGPVNLVAERELAELDETRTQGAAESEELAQAIHRLRGSIGNLNREGRVRLLDAYERVDGHFRRLFTTLFDGGQAHLELVESDDPLEAGLEIMAQPPGKRLSTMTLLSGGEQALTAIALIFALFLTNPAPICVLDEVDAPLDDANVERFCDLLDRMTQETDTRYLIVTHNAVTMSRMHRLYGVTMIEKGVSRLVSVDLGGAETLLAAE
jgi:chromosome segregation protein